MDTKHQPQLITNHFKHHLELLAIALKKTAELFAE